MKRTFLTLLFLSQISTAAQAKSSQELMELYKAANFFQIALDEGLKEGGKSRAQFCNLETQEISKFIMQTKARIDAAWKKNSQEKSLRPLLETSVIAHCSTECFCDLYTDLKEMIAEKKITLSTNFLPLLEKASSRQKKEIPLQCAKQNKNFCTSKLFQQIKKDVNSFYSSH